MQAAAADIMRLPTLAEFDAADRLDAYKADPWHWIRDCVWTVDPADSETPIKAFPVAACEACPRYAGGDEVAYAGPDTYLNGSCRVCEGPLKEMAYLRWLTRRWQAGGHPSHQYPVAPAGQPMPAPMHPRLANVNPRLAVPKPRRMRASWLMIALHTHLALFRPHARVFVMSSKEEKSDELIERAKGILIRLTPSKMKPLTEGVDFKRKTKPPLIEFANGSQLFGVAEGPEQLRQYTATAILADEIGTWTWPRETYTAFKPCIDGGGQITMISSAYPGFWAELCEGSLTA